MRSSPARLALTAVMDLLVVWAVGLTTAIVVRFFAVLGAASVAQVLLRFTETLVLPLGLPDVLTPYGGRFSVDAALTVGLVLAAEWGLSLVRRRTL